MTSHELAKKLLELPDLPIVVEEGSQAAFYWYSPITGFSVNSGYMTEPDQYGLIEWVDKVGGEEKCIRILL